MEKVQSWPKGNKPKVKSESMSKQLSKLRKHVRPNATSSDKMKDPSPSPMKWKADGEDHINIWDNSVTGLGRYLSHNSELPFKHNVFGRFSSMEAFWHYILSDERDDRIRTMRGPVLRAFARKLTTLKITNFRAIIADSNYQRIMTYENLVNDITKSTLPFDHYYTNDAGIRIRPNYFKWLIAGFEEIRKALKEHREPDFTFLIDNPGSTTYQYVVPEKSGIATVPTTDTLCKDTEINLLAKDDTLRAANLVRLKDIMKQSTETS